jgi:AcrR family transcriptional regulator
MSPKLVDKGKRKEDLALVALDIFADKGFEATSINDIAKAADIAKGTVYEYFESKEELVFEALTAWVRLFEKELLKFRESINDPEQRLIELVHSSMEMFINDPRAVKLMSSIFQLILTDSQLLSKHDIIRESLQGIRKMITDILLDGISKGIFRSEVAREAEKIAINLLAYMDGIALHYFLSNNFFDLTEQVDFYMDELIRYLKPLQGTGDRK